MTNEIKRPWRRLLSLGIVGIFCLTVLLPVAFPGATAFAAECRYHYKVQAGDTIQYVANLYNIGWKKIADANGLGAPYAIAPGQNLCIPGGERPAEDRPGKPRSNPTLDVQGSLSDFTVTVTNFPGRTSYYVRIIPSGGAVSYRVGGFTTSHDGDFSGAFPLPLFARRTRTMQVCVKNVWTDAVSCEKFIDPYYYVFPLQPRCTGSAKTAR